MTREQIILDKLRSLPPEQVEEVLDFVEFIQQRVKRQQWISFDQWAMNLTPLVSNHAEDYHDIGGGPWLLSRRAT